MCSIGTQLPQKKGTPTPTTFLAHVYCGKTAGWIKVPLGTEVNLGSSDVVLDGVAAPRKKEHSLPQFSDHVYCCQTARWMRTPLGTEVDFSPGHIVLDGVLVFCERGTAAPPLFSAHVYCGHGRPSQLLLSSCQHRITVRHLYFLKLKYCNRDIKC